MAGAGVGGSSTGAGRVVGFGVGAGLAISGVFCTGFGRVVGTTGAGVGIGVAVGDGMVGDGIDGGICGLVAAIGPSLDRPTLDVPALDVPALVAKTLEAAVGTLDVATPGTMIS